MTVRMTQRGRRRGGAGGCGAGRDGRAGRRPGVRGRGERGGVGKGAPPDDGRAWNREHRRPIRSAAPRTAPRHAQPCPPFAVT
ncbi:hypothetical protein C1708_19630 [Streptomyces sp. DH-12]|nr:hypothetical protein C1708_19630 [Streptomyces sp. DH-12]